MKHFRIKKKLLREKARQLLRDRRILYLAKRAFEALGVVGEERTGLAVFLAALTTKLPEPVSILIKGASSSGKSNIARKILYLFPPDLIEERTSLSAKAPAYSEDSLANRILFLQEYRGGKDAQ